MRPSYRGLPGQPGCRRARQHLRDQIPDLTTACLEAANAALRQQLTGLCRTLARAVQQRCDEAGAGIAAALRMAEELGERAAAESSHTERELAEREQALRRVLRLLPRAVA